MAGPKMQQVYAAAGETPLCRALGVDMNTFIRAQAVVYAE